MAWDLDESLKSYVEQYRTKEQQMLNLKNAIAQTQREMDILSGIIRGMEEVKANVEIEADGE